MKPGIQLLLIVVVIMSAIPLTRTDSCDYVAKSRVAGTYEPAMVEIKAHNHDPHIKIPFCLIKDGGQCYPNNYFVDQQISKHNELAEMERHMKIQLPNSKNRIIGIGKFQVQDEIGQNSVSSRQFRGFSCKSGKCSEDIADHSEDSKISGTCQPCDSTKEDCTDGTINWKGFLFLENQLAYKQRLNRWLLVKKENYEQDLRNKVSTSDLSCSYVGRNTDTGEKIAARIEITKGGGEFRIGICTISNGNKCFPNTKEEFMMFKDHLEKANVFPEFDFPEPVDESKKPEQDTATPPMQLKSWNCGSGVCDSKSLMCVAKKGVERVSKVWKVYEYTAHSMGTRNLSFTRLFLAIKLTVVLILL